jgi:hypothetical protein
MTFSEFIPCFSQVVSQDSNFADGEYEEVVEGNHATATYSSFLKSRHSFSWGIEETRLFYQVFIKKRNIHANDHD